MEKFTYIHPLLFQILPPNFGKMNVNRLDPYTVCLLKEDKILSPWVCVKELIKNSIQSQADNVAVRVDLDPNNIRIQVLDDGLGVNSLVSKI